MAGYICGKQSAAVALCGVTTARRRAARVEAATSSIRILFQRLEISGDYAYQQMLLVKDGRAGTPIESI